MAIIRTGTGKYQVRVRGLDDRQVTKVFSRKSDAKAQEREWERQKELGTFASALQKITVVEFFGLWFQTHREETSHSGWRKTQLHYAKDYIIPVIGNIPLQKVTPATIECRRGFAAPSGT